MLVGEDEVAGLQMIGNRQRDSDWRKVSEEREMGTVCYTRREEGKGTERGIKTHLPPQFKSFGFV